MTGAIGAMRRGRLVALAIVLIATLMVSSPAPVSSQAAAPGDCVAMTDSITRLYSAYFLRQPDAGGYNFWSGEFASGRRGLQGMSDFFATSDEFRSLYANLSNREFVELVYQNVLDRQPDAAGLNFWTGQLDSRAMTRGTVMINFSESTEYVRLTNTIAPLAGYFNWYPEGATFSCGFGDFSLEANGKTQLDVVSFHFGEIDSAGSPIEILGIGQAGNSSVGENYVPYNHLYRDQFTSAPGANDFLAVRSGPQVLTYAVSYEGAPMIDFDQRGGQKPGERTRPTTDEFFGDIEGAVTVVEWFWANNWSNHFPGTYQAPFVLGTYDGYAASPPTCGGQQLPPFNAVYCPIGHYVAWDVNLLSFFYAEQGDALVYLVVAHEWGHAIQARMPANQVAQQIELQADCLGGAALAGATVNTFRTDGTGLIWEAGDAAEVIQALESIADETPWSNSNSHGNADERIGAFIAGTQGGVQACIPS